MSQHSKISLKDVNATLHTLTQALAELNQSEIKIFDLIIYFFIFIIIAGCVIGVLECFNIVCVDKTRKTAKQQHHLLQAFQQNGEGM